MTGESGKGVMTAPPIFEFFDTPGWRFDRSDRLLR
jgi:hypothetical protein